ncbi:uncharacterized protein E0L32_003505 [Thyridium curvatum]|uniref:Mediator of RNA polymerase II transcription subunit 1 n=1 Tax=Thyridium curvatum TaxID=1093900 RepID=A0A507BBR0_9PEZI|nr:uncharacterized protein E0L32_003505 [Thyridium curvatum]TPX16943.1 hypothetical protein E0L32_003505 [Thyridium curvatum]
MSTPTPMKHAPSQQGRTPSQSQHGAVATPGVSTPFSQAHAAFSPQGGPRSSPQTIRRSPATSTTLMGHSGNAPVNFDSPSAAAALGALGIGGGLDLNLDGVSVGGLGGLGLGRADDDERARRLKGVIDILKKSKGYVSEAGLERLAQMTGLECMWEEGKGSDKSRTLIIAGSALALEVVFINNIVQAVNLTFPESAEMVMRHVDKAGQILFNDLKLLPHESPLCKKLDKFAANLESLAVLDKLSVIPGLNLHEAVAGIFESLHRLHKWDVKKLREDPANSGKTEEALETMALCARHGMPVMHARERLGLSLDYWKERHHTPPLTKRTKELAKLDERTWAILIECAPIGDMVYASIRISDTWISPEVEQQPTEPSLLPPTPDEPLLDWREPDNTFLPATDEEAKQSGPDGTQQHPTMNAPKLPEVVFMAKLDPPVTVTYSVGHQLYQLIGLTPAAEYNLVTFDALNFPIAPGTNHDPSEPRRIVCHKEVHVKTGAGAGASMHKATHKNQLFIYKPVYGKTLEELPFSHPNQLIRMLPTLRQYTFLATLLEKSFDTRMGEVFEKTADDAAKEEEEKKKKKKEEETVETTTVPDEFFKFMSKSKNDNLAEGTAGARDSSCAMDISSDDYDDPRRIVNGDEDKVDLQMDVMLTAHPVPRLQVTFPLRDGETADVMLEIRANGLVHVVSQNILPGGDGGDDDDDEDADMWGGGGGGAGDGGGGGDGAMGKGKDKAAERPQLKPQDLGRLLERCEDLGVWCEWIRRRLA